MFKGTSHSETLEGGAGNDTFRGLGGADKFSGGAGSDTFIWLKKDMADLKMDHIADFEMGTDRLDLSDFLKGQGIKGAQYSDVVRIEDSADHSGAVIKALSGGNWVDVVQLDHVDAGSLTLHDLGLVRYRLTLADCKTESAPARLSKGPPRAALPPVRPPMRADAVHVPPGRNRVCPRPFCEARRRRSTAKIYGFSTLNLHLL